MTGAQALGGDAAVTFAGYRSAGSNRSGKRCQRGLRLRQASSPLAPCVKLRGGGGRACYKAAGWQPCGITKGFTREHRADYFFRNNRPKKLWLRPLN
ncbi:MAG: hypothetical protein RLZZ522_1450, partial [Verrucomicrobiota bacterium]